MATTHLSSDKRNEIMRNVGKLLPHTSSYKLAAVNNTALEIYKEEFVKLSLDQIIKDPIILTNDYTIESYNKHQVFTHFTELHIAVPKLYVPQTKDQYNNTVPTLGESVGNTVLYA